MCWFVTEKYFFVFQFVIVITFFFPHFFAFQTFHSIIFHVVCWKTFLFSTVHRTFVSVVLRRCIYFVRLDNNVYLVPANVLTLTYEPFENHFRRNKNIDKNFINNMFLSVLKNAVTVTIANFWNMLF